MRADGTIGFVDRSLEQWRIHSLYRNNFNVIDMHNAKRQGVASFEDSWKTKWWWLRDFQMLFGMSEVNFYLLRRHFRPSQQVNSDQDPDMFRRRLAFQMLKHPVWMREMGEAMSLRLGGPCNRGHYLVENPKAENGRLQRRTCKYCIVKTGWACACSPWVDGMTVHQMEEVMFVCRSITRECFQKNQEGVSPPNKKSEAAFKSWGELKRGPKRLRGGKGGFLAQDATQLQRTCNILSRFPYFYWYCCALIH